MLGLSILDILVSSGNTVRKGINGLLILKRNHSITRKPDYNGELMKTPPQRKKVHFAYEYSLLVALFRK